MTQDATVLDRLFAVVESRHDGDPEKSHTARLFARGTEKIAQKVGEEAVETVIAATSRDNAALIAESADLLYHLVVLWSAAGLKPADVWSALEARAGRSGLEEKARR